MAKAQTIDFIRRRLNTYGDEIQVTSEKTKAVIDITGMTFVMYVGPSKTPDLYTDYLYSITGTIIDAADGRVEFAPTEEQATQPDGTMYHEVVMTDAVGRTRTVAMGKYTYY